MNEKYQFAPIEMDEVTAYVPVGEKAQELAGFIAVDLNAADIMDQLDQGVSDMELVNLLVANSSQIRMVKVESVELGVIRELSVKANEGECSQYTYQELMDRLDKALN